MVLVLTTSYKSPHMWNHHSQCNFALSNDETEASDRVFFFFINYQNNRPSRFLQQLLNILVLKLKYKDKYATQRL